MHVSHTNATALVTFMKFMSHFVPCWRYDERRNTSAFFARNLAKVTRSHKKNADEASKSPVVGDASMLHDLGAQILESQTRCQTGNTSINTSYSVPVGAF